MSKVEEAAPPPPVPRPATTNYGFSVRYVNTLDELDVCF